MDSSTEAVKTSVAVSQPPAILFVGVHLIRRLIDTALRVLFISNFLF